MATFLKATAQNALGLKGCVFCGNGAASRFCEQLRFGGVRPGNFFLIYKDRCQSLDCPFLAREWDTFEQLLSRLDLPDLIEKIDDLLRDLPTAARLNALQENFLTSWADFGGRVLFLKNLWDNELVTAIHIPFNFGINPKLRAWLCAYEGGVELKHSGTGNDADAKSAITDAMVPEPQQAQPKAVLSNPKWAHLDDERNKSSAHEASLNEEILLDVDVENLSSGTPVDFTVIDKGANGQSEILDKLKGKVDGGAAHTKWSVKLGKAEKHEIVFEAKYGAITSGQGKINVVSPKVIRKGDNGTIVEETNIRLAGFGGGVPSDTFDDKTEAKVKQFQKDFMKMENPSGEVDEDTARAINDLSNKYTIDFSQLRCPCEADCGGFGKQRHKDEYAGEELYNKYEYPGIHRSLLWAIRGLMFYLESEKNPEVKIMGYSAGYRCHDNNAEHLDKNKKPRTSTNHMGKAIDILIETKENGQWIRHKEVAANKILCDKVRGICQDKFKAQIRWKKRDTFSMEPSEPDPAHKNEAIAPDWVHVDVRQFVREEYLQDKFFCKDMATLNGQPLTL